MQLIEYLALQSRSKHQAEGLFEKTNCSSVNYKLEEYSVLFVIGGYEEKQGTSRLYRFQEVLVLFLLPKPARIRLKIFFRSVEFLESMEQRIRRIRSRGLLFMT